MQKTRKKSVLFFDIFFFNLVYTEISKYSKEHFLTVAGIYLKKHRRK